ncbi:hypothetical protein HQ585_09830 [candidate division KSB1 bacterium]|nr:hypothetical protein [candidate division KSB1 bacterium]
MHLVTFTFDVHQEDQQDFIQKLDSLKSFWQDQGIEFSLYRDQTQKTRFLQLLRTDQLVDEISRLIKTDEQAKAVFESIRAVAARVSISFLDRVV